MTKNKLKAFALQKPILFSILIILLAAFFTEIPLQNLIAPYWDYPSAWYLTITLEQGLTGCLLFVLLARFGWLNMAGFTHPRQWRVLWLGWPLLIFTLINGLDFLSGNLIIDTSKPLLLLLNLLAALSTGWIEEVLGRGAVLVSLLQKWGRTRKGVYLAVLVSSALFGILHILNFLQGRLPLINTLSQMTFAVFFGIVFAACMLRNRSIWPMIFLHAAIDWAGNLSEISVGSGLHTTVPTMSIGDALVNVLICSVLGLYGLFILRKVPTLPVTVTSASSDDPGTAGLSAE